MRASAGIAAKRDLADEVAVEALMNYRLSLPEADDLIVGFLRGDPRMFSIVERSRHRLFPIHGFGNAVHLELEFPAHANGEEPLRLQL